MAEVRTAHPFHMHDAIHAQADAFRDVTARRADAAEAFAAGISPQGRLFLVGTGTSLHAAMIGAHLFRVFGGGRLALPVPAFDFALYGPDLRPEDTVVVLSHRGTKTYSLAALERARVAGCTTALICGEGAPDPSVRPAFVFPTVPQERSSAHTVSYVGTIAVLAAMAASVGHERAAHAAGLCSEIPSLLRRALLLESKVAAMAHRHAHHRRIWLAGAGPDAVTAAEIALKLKETSYVQAEGMAVEALLHGPFQCVEPEDLFVLIAVAGPGSDRMDALVRMVGDVGAPCLWIGSATPPDGASCEAVTVPDAPAPFGCLTSLIPLQLFAYHVALTRGFNPDGFRLEDPRFARAAQEAKL